jgi:hypothetical protein
VWPRPPDGWPGPDPNYRLLPGVRQPHLQFVDWQRHAPFGHPQEQLVQSHAPQQVFVAAVWSGAFFRFVIVFSSFRFSASCAFKRADVRPRETLQWLRPTFFKGRSCARASALPPGF